MAFTPYGSILILACFIPRQTSSQSLITTPDTIICHGTSLQIQTIPALEYSWSPAAYLNNPNTTSPVSTPSETITYYVTGLITGTNVIRNGNFSDGNTEFLSGYNYVTDNTAEGEYFVGNDPVSWNSSLSNCKDHTTGTGNMMMVNGSPTVDVLVWSQDITVTPNTDYAFSTWIQALWPPNPAKLQFSINGVILEDVITAQLPTCTWSQFYTIWNSGTQTSATISIVNKNTEILGNDFALDDISFAPVQTIQDSITITVDKPVVIASEDTAICPGDSIRLNVVGADSYNWAPLTGLSETDTNDPIAAPLSTTEYIVNGTSENGCSAKDTTNISVFSKPVTFVSNDTMVCRNTPVQLSSGGGLSYSWLPATGLNNAEIESPIATINEPITYTVKITDEHACTNTDSIKISIRPYPDFQAFATSPVCEGTSARLSASGGDIFEWQPSEFFSDPFAPQSIVAIPSSTPFSVRIAENTCGNDTIIHLAVTVYPAPVVSVSKTNDINCNTPTALLTASGALEYSWTPTYGLENPTTPTPTVTLDTTTEFKVTGINEFGCTSSSSVIVNVKKEGIPRFVVPNAFTPNGDSKNDCFGIKRWGNAKIEQFSIYNRWGQLVFQSRDPSQCWDGTYNGKPQDSGGYVYIIKAETLCGIVTRKGILTLIR